MPPRSRGLTARMPVMLSDEDRELWHALAEIEGRSVADLVRDALKQDVERRMADPTLREPVIRARREIRERAENPPVAAKSEEIPTIGTGYLSEWGPCPKCGAESSESFGAVFRTRAEGDHSLWTCQGSLPMNLSGCGYQVKVPR